MFRELGRAIWEASALPRLQVQISMAGGLLPSPCTHQRWVPGTSGGFAHPPLAQLWWLGTPFPWLFGPRENAAAEPWPQIWPLFPNFCALGDPLVSFLVPPSPGVPVRGCAGVWGSRKGVLGAPAAPLRNPQPAPGTSSRSQREPADLAAVSEGGGMEGARRDGGRRKAARGQNEIMAGERGW